jgi:hypothetical protein
MLRLQELGLAATLTNNLDNHGEPQGFAEANKSESWMDSKREKLSSLINNQTWSLVDLPPGRKLVSSGWLNKARKNEHGAIYSLKSRLVAKRHSQKSESTIFTPSRLLETKRLSDSSLLLPCISDSNFLIWT